MSDSDSVTQADIHEQLKKWQMGLEELQKTVDRAEAQRRAELTETVKALREQFEQAQALFEGLSEEEGSEWDRFRKGMEKGRRLLDQALKEAGPEPFS